MVVISTITGLDDLRFGTLNKTRYYVKINIFIKYKNSGYPNGVSKIDMHGVLVKTLFKRM